MTLLLPRQGEGGTSRTHTRTALLPQMYMGVSWPVSSRNIDVGIVFMWICERMADVRETGDAFVLCCQS